MTPPNEGLLRLQSPGGIWTAVDVVARTGSTNADLLVRAAEGAPAGRVLVAEEQTAGRGRLGRSWVSVPGASLTFSVLLRPVSVPPARRGWLPLLTGVAVASAVRAAAAVPALLKWPNDVLVGDRKLAGILAEQATDGSAVVVGVGLNVVTPEQPLPAFPGSLPATSLRAEGAAEIGRDVLLLAILREFEHRYLAFTADPDPDRTGLHAEYAGLCDTLGRDVRVDLPGGQLLTGTAISLDPDGRLLVAQPGSAARTPVSAGDVIHLR